MFVVHDLAVLVAVADSGSVRRAAGVLGRTQPAVSQAIQRLEEAVGFALLDRSGYRARLTERGEKFVARARVAVKQARDLHSFASVLSNGIEARLRISVHGAIPIASWLPLIEDMQARFPDTVLELQPGEGNAPLRRLLSDEADLAIVLRPPLEQNAIALDFEPCGELDFVSVVRSSNLRSSNLHEDLTFLPQILVADFEDPESAFGVVEGHRYWRVGDYQIKAALIRAGKGWGSVPAMLVEPSLHDGSLSTIAYSGLVPRSRHPYFMCRKSERQHGPAAAFIWEHAQRR